MLTLSFTSEPSTSAGPSLEEALRTHLCGALENILTEELEMFLHEMSGKRTADGRRAVVHNGHHHERIVQTGLGPVPVRVPRTRDRNGDGDCFQSAIIPACKRRSATFDESVCYFYLKGLSTGDMLPALRELFGPDVGNLSPASVSRLTRRWTTEYEQWNRRDLGSEQYVYVWVDGIHFKGPHQRGEALHVGDHGGCQGRTQAPDRRGRRL